MAIWAAVAAKLAPTWHEPSPASVSAWPDWPWPWPFCNQPRAVAAVAEEAARATRAVEAGRTAASRRVEREDGSSAEAVVAAFHEVEREDVSSAQIGRQHERVAQKSPRYAQRAAQPTPLLSIPGFDAMAPVEVLWECQVPWYAEKVLFSRGRAGALKCAAALEAKSQMYQ